MAGKPAQNPSSLPDPRTLDFSADAHAAIVRLADRLELEREDLTGGTFAPELARSGVQAINDLLAALERTRSALGSPTEFTSQNVCEDILQQQRQQHG